MPHFIPPRNSARYVFTLTCVLWLGTWVWSPIPALAEEDEFELQERTEWHELPKGLNYAEDVPAGYVMVGDMLRPQAALAKATYLPNPWLNGIVPYSFDNPFPDAVYSWQGPDLVFRAEQSPTLPYINDPAGSFNTGEFEVGDVVAIIGTQFNQVLFGSNYVIAAIDNFYIYFESGTPVVNEHVPANVTLATLSTVSPLNQQRFIDATLRWEAKVAGVRFVPRTNEADFILIENGTRNRSEVGWEANGPQQLMMNRWTKRNGGTLVHEIGHGLGYKHEHTRPDRDDFVTVITENLNEDAGTNYDIASDSWAYPTRLNAVYDFASIMHYSQCGFSICASCSGEDTCITLAVVAPEDSFWQTSMGQRDSISYWDAQVMNYIYPEVTSRFLDANSSASGGDPGSFVRPFTTFTQAVNGSPSGSRLIILYPESYNEPGTYSNPVAIESPLGSILIE